MTVITAIITLILVAITGYYAWQTRKLVEETRRGLEDTLGGRVVLFFELRGQTLILAVTNMGQTAATNVRFHTEETFDPATLQAFAWNRLKPFLDAGFDWIAPGRTYYRDSNTVGGVAQWESQHPGERLAIEVRVSFHDGFRDRTTVQKLAPQDILRSEILGPLRDIEMDTGRRIARAIEALSASGASGGSIYSELARIRTLLEGARGTQS